MAARVGMAGGIVPHRAAAAMGKAGWGGGGGEM
jgi:hypothetical protein